MNVQNKINVSDADKQAAKEGAKTCWTSFKTFVDRFTELIFIATMMGACVYTVLIDMVLSKKAVDKDGKAVPNTPDKHWVEMIIQCIYLVMLSGVTVLSMRGDERMLKYFGFLRGKLSKAFFYLFCTSLVFPVNQTDKDFYDPRCLAAYTLLVISILQIVKVFTKDDNDTNDESPMMDEYNPENQNNKSVDYSL